MKEANPMGVLTEVSTNPQDAGWLKDNCQITNGMYLIPNTDLSIPIVFKTGTWQREQKGTLNFGYRSPEEREEAKRTRGDADDTSLLAVSVTCNLKTDTGDPILTERECFIKYRPRRVGGQERDSGWTRAAKGMSSKTYPYKLKAEHQAGDDTEVWFRPSFEAVRE